MSGDRVQIFGRRRQAGMRRRGCGGRRPRFRGRPGWAGSARDRRRSTVSLSFGQCGRGREGPLGAGRCRGAIRLRGGGRKRRAGR